MAQTILTVIFFVFIIALAVMMIRAMSRPDEFRIERAIDIAAPPERIFPLLNDFRAWPQWSPWEKKDPAMTRRYGATTVGAGATYAWEGDRNVGKGEMRIADTMPPSRVAIDLHFIKPFRARNAVAFTLEPRGAGTYVTWTMRGPSPFLFKIMHLFIDMDRMVGKDMEQGLANLKAAAER